MLVNIVLIISILLILYGIISGIYHVDNVEKITLSATLSISLMLKFMALVDSNIYLLFNFTSRDTVYYIIYKTICVVAGIILTAIINIICENLTTLVYKIYLLIPFPKKSDSKSDK